MGPSTPQFQDRFSLHDPDDVGADQIPTPLRFVDGPAPAPSRAPALGQHTTEVLRDLLGLEDGEIERLRATSAVY